MQYLQFNPDFDPASKLFDILWLHHMQPIYNKQYTNDVIFFKINTKQMQINF